MTEKEFFESKLKEAMELFRKKKLEELCSSLEKAFPLMTSTNKVDFDFEHMEYVVIGKRSAIIFDGKLYALIHFKKQNLIHKSLDLNEIYQYYIEIELNMD